MYTLYLKNPSIEQLYGLEYALQKNKRPSGTVTVNLGDCKHCSQPYGDHLMLGKCLFDTSSYVPANDVIVRWDVYNKESQSARDVWWREWLNINNGLNKVVSAFNINAAIDAHVAGRGTIVIRNRLNQPRIRYADSGNPLPRYGIDADYDAPGPVGR